MEISVIIPVYNKAEYLDRCFESIFAQPFGSFEVVAVDDGSTDGSGELCDQWARRESRLHVVHVANGGVTAARRKGVEQSTSRYIMFADADDLLTDGALQMMHEAIERSGADEVIATFRTQDGVASPVVYEGFVEGDELMRYIMTGKNRFSVLWSIIFRRELLDGVFDIPRDIVEGEDKMMQMKVLMKRPWVYFIKEQAYIYTLGLPNARRHTLERERLYDALLRQLLGSRLDEFATAFKLHQLKEYERFLLDGDFTVKKAYYQEAVGTLPAGIPLYDRLVYALPPACARWVVRLYRAIIDYKQKGL